MVLHSIFFSFDEELLLQNILVLINAFEKKKNRANFLLRD